MLFYILNREMKVVASMSNDVDGTMWIDDSSGGQTITLTNGCAIGSYDFTTDPYHKDSVYITAGNFIAFNDKYDRTRLYTIMTVEGDDTLDVHCEDIGLDLINEMADAWDYDTERTFDFYANQAIGSSSWSIVYETEGLSTQTRTLTYDNNTDTKLARLESIVSDFGFECDFQVTMELMKIKSMEIHVYSKLQNRSETDIVQRFVDSINLVSLNRSESIEDLYTAVLPLGGTSDDGKTVDISDIVYDDGQYFTTKGDNKLYDRTYGKKWNRYVGTSHYKSTDDFDYIVGHYSSSATSASALLKEALADLKTHHDVKLAYEADLIDLNADLGDYIEIVDHTKQTDVYLRARIQEVTNYYTVSDSDKGTLANYTIMSTSNGDSIRSIINSMEIKISSNVVSVATEYYVSTSPTSMEGGSWSEEQPSWKDGTYIWSRSKSTTEGGVVTYSTAARITGAAGSSGAKGDKGDKGEDGNNPNWNLLNNSSFTQNLDGWTEVISSTTKEFVSVNDIACLKISEESTKGRFSVEQTQNIAWVYGQPLVVSLDAWSNTTEQSNTLYQIRAILTGKTESDISTSVTVAQTLSLTSTMQKYILVIDSNKYTGKMVSLDSIAIRFYFANFVGDVYFRNAKLEVGSVATEWMPAQSELDEAKTSITTAQTTADSAGTTADEAKQSATSNSNKIEAITLQVTGNEAKIGTVSEDFTKAQEEAKIQYGKLEDATKLISANTEDITPLKQVVTIDSTGVKVKQATESSNYSQIQNTGLHVFMADKEVAKFGTDSIIENLAVKSYFMFGNHRAEKLTMEKQKGTAFYYIGDDE